MSACLSLCLFYSSGATVLNSNSRAYRYTNISCTDNMHIYRTQRIFTTIIYFIIVFSVGLNQFIENGFKVFNKLFLNSFKFFLKVIL